MPAKRRLTETELQAARYNFEEAKASLACEGIYLTEEEETLFRRFEDERLSHDERRRRIIAFCRQKRRDVIATALVRSRNPREPEPQR